MSEIMDTKLCFKFTQSSHDTFLGRQLSKDYTIVEFVKL